MRGGSVLGRAGWGSARRAGTRRTGHGQGFRAFWRSRIRRAGAAPVCALGRVQKPLSPLSVESRGLAPLCDWRVRPPPRARPLDLSLAGLTLAAARGGDVPQA
eukprot:1413834-Prymnesium_polylepis.1